MGRHSQQILTPEKNQEIIMEAAKEYYEVFGRNLAEKELPSFAERTENHLYMRKYCRITTERALFDVEPLLFKTIVSPRYDYLLLEKILPDEKYFKLRSILAFLPFIFDEIKKYEKFPSIIAPFIYLFLYSFSVVISIIVFKNLTFFLILALTGIIGALVFINHSKMFTSPNKHIFFKKYASIRAGVIDGYLVELQDHDQANNKQYNSRVKKLNNIKMKDRKILKDVKDAELEIRLFATYVTLYFLRARKDIRTTVTRAGSVNGFFLITET
jgi:hypothetical protein